MTQSFARLFDDPSMRDFARRLPRSSRLKPGDVAPNKLTIPEGKAQKLMPEVARLVADLPRGSTPEVVWSDGGSELMVNTDSIRIACTSGLIRVSVVVECDQLDGPTTITVPLAVGTKDKTTGLVMSTYDVLEGPKPVVDYWFDPLVAFSWECLLELCRRLAAEVGDDQAGRALIPGAVAATTRQLIVQPMARHDLLSRSRG